ncbi:hypothetical protein NQ176_g1339 [Zarea fungicola]|uniref:Uncharacterized protein n=1 Tax=Zarea fungicola TaxID=93591 RepID=A0ACC1NVQ9_9HYPO|nr:hypothetical protein NQ176_g1339 [Lecanicillium fungicola]
MMAKNQTLENIVEELGKSFDTFSSQLIRSGFLASHSEVATSFRDTLKTFASLSQQAHRETVDVEQCPAHSADEATATEPKVPPESSSNEEISILPQVPSTPVSSVYPQPPFIRTPMQNLAPGLRIMQTISPILSTDYWKGDILNNSDLPFQQVLLRSTLLESHKYLRQKHFEIHMTSWMSQCHAYSLKIRSAMEMLRLNSIILQLIAMQDQERAGRGDLFGLEPTGLAATPELISTRKFDLEDMLNLGSQLRSNMISDGVQLPDLITPAEVETYLVSLGMISYNRQHIQMAVELEDEFSGTGRQVVIMIDTQTLIHGLLTVAVCLGDCVGFPLSKLNDCITSATMDVKERTA